MENIKNLIKENPNDMDLGSQIRTLFRNNSNFGKIIKENPNDMDLGSQVRNAYLNERYN